MNKHASVIGTSLLLLALAGCDAATGDDTVRLSACSADDTPFAEKPFREWDEYYHAAVSDIVERNLTIYDDLHLQPIRCGLPQALPAGDTLREIADALPEWTGKDISENDAAPILLEFLRVYECALMERREFLQPRLLEERTAQQGNPFEQGELTLQTTNDRTVIRNELLTARESLNRALVLMGGMERMATLSTGLECIKRSSLDLRNGLGLAADAVSCLPRTWNGKSSLVDIPGPDDE